MKIYPLKLTVRVTSKEKATIEKNAKKSKAESVSRFMVGRSMKTITTGVEGN